VVFTPVIAIGGEPSMTSAPVRWSGATGSLSDTRTQNAHMSFVDSAGMEKLDPSVPSTTR
jgi:hypothetical protein